MKKIVVVAVMLFMSAMAHAEIAIWPPQTITSPNGKWHSEITKTRNPTKWKVTVFAVDKSYKKSHVAWSQVFDFKDKGGNRFNEGHVSSNGRTVVYTAPYSHSWAIAMIVQPRCIKFITSKDVPIKSKNIMTMPAKWLKKKTSLGRPVSFEKHRRQVRFHTVSGDYIHRLDCKRGNTK